MTARMLAAGTGLPSGRPMVIFSGCLAAAWTNRPAGRACKPTEEPIFTRMVAMSLLRESHVSEETITRPLVVKQGFGVGLLGFKWSCLVSPGSSGRDLGRDLV